jgi:hypothetical protein
MGGKGACATGFFFGEGDITVEGEYGRLEGVLGPVTWLLEKTVGSL